MKTPDGPVTAAMLEEIWSLCPWGVASIDRAGNVSAVNVAFEQHTGTAGSDLLGASEATLVAQLGSLPLERTRVEGEGDGQLRAAHFFRRASSQARQERDLSLLAEALREPLASIYGFAELLLTQGYDEDTRLDLTETLLKQVELLSDLINERLDVSKAQER